MVSINYWVEHQDGRTSMPDTSRMIPAIESDRAGQPWVEFGRDWFYSVCVSECAFALPLWDMSDVDHVHCFDLWWKFLLSPHVRLARSILVYALRSLPLVFGGELAGLLQHPTTAVGMVHRFSWGAMDLAVPV